MPVYDVARRSPAPPAMSRQRASRSQETGAQRLGGQRMRGLRRRVRWIRFWLTCGVWIAAFGCLGPSSSKAAVVETSKGERLTILGSRAEAEALRPGDTFAFVCSRCRSVWTTKIRRQEAKGHLCWFDRSRPQPCPACGGETRCREGRGGQMEHLCSRCGEKGVFACGSRHA